MEGQDVLVLITVHDWNRVGADVLLGIARSCPILLTRCTASF